MTIRILGIVVLGLLLSTGSFASTKKGKGEVTIKDSALDHFITYIRGKKSMKPQGFILSSDGSWSSYWYCAHSRCAAGNFNPTIRKCEEETGVNCGLFASRRTIVWKNQINPGKGKISTINSKWSDTEIRAKLTELGFLGGSSSSSTTTTSKITKKKPKKVIKSTDINKSDIVSQIKDLKELLDAGVITQDEFDKAKKKLLN